MSLANWGRGVSLLLIFSLAACSKIEELGSQFFTKSGSVAANVTVTGMTGQGLIIKLNDQLQSVTASSAAFSTNLVNGDSYTVSVATQPVLPAQICSPSSSATGVASAGQINIAINCTAPPAWAIQGTTTGYAGSGLQVQLNSGEILNVTTSSFAFTTAITDNQPYNVQVKTQPTSPAQICTAQRNVGLVTGANVTDVSINCSTVTFSVGGFITGLSNGTSVTLQVNGTQNTARASDGFFTFTNKLADQTNYNITVLTQPTGQTCSVGNGAGILDGQGSYAASIQCSSTTHTISGTLSGLSGGYTTLVTSTGEFLPVTANGAFSFTKNFATNSNYVVEVFRNPAAPAQTCTVANGTGTITSNISNVTVSCTANGYSIGGTSTVSGLTSSGLVLRLNGASDVVVPANSTSFSFSETIADGSSYTVTIAAQPAGQKCTLSNATGTAGAAVTNVTVSCVNGYTVGGTVTGYTGSNLVLRNTINGTPLDLVISSNSAFTFPGLLVGGDTYAVSIANYPETPYQNCSITSGSGTVAAANITNISITCTNVTLAFTAVSSSPTEAVGAHNIALSLSGATPRAGSVDIVISGGSATNTLDYTLAATTISWSALATPGNVVANIIDDAFNEGTETIQISLSNPVGITLGAQTTHTVTITDNDAASAVGAAIATNKVSYYDADRNGKIDHVLIEFDKNVKDSTHTGWVNATTDFSVTGQWAVAGYSNVKFVPQYCLDRSIPANGNCTDTGDINNAVDDQYVVLSFDEGTTYDTGAAPQLTLTNVTLKTLATAPNDCYVQSSGASCQSTTASFMPTGMVDKAQPVLVAAWADPIIDAWQLRMVWSEAVDKDGGVCGTAPTRTDFTYTNTGGNGASWTTRTDFVSGSTGCSGSPSTGYLIVPRVDARFTHADLYPTGTADTIAIANGVLQDSVGNQNVATTKTITYDPNLELYYPMDGASPISDTNSTVHDVSGKSRDGTTAGGMKIARDMGENNSQAFLFDGLDDQITATGYTGINGNANRTVSLWVQTSSPKATNGYISWGTNSTNSKFTFGHNPSTGEVYFHSFSRTKSGQKRIVDGSWHHVAVTFANDGTPEIVDLQFYVDGIAVAQSAISNDVMNTIAGGDLLIGRDIQGGQWLRGKLDEVRLYSRALSATEIKKLAVKVPSGLVAHYQLNTDGVDNSGNNFDGTRNGSPSDINDRYNLPNSAMSFNGSSQYLQIADNATLNPSSAITVSAWVTSPNWSTCLSGDMDMVSKANSGGFILECDLTSSKIGFMLHRNGNFARVGSPAASLVTNRWHNLTGTYDGRYTKFYLDGFLIETDDAGANYSIGTSALDLSIARSMYAPAPSYFSGSIDDVRIYNRALTAGEVAALATELDRGLVAYYPLDDAAATAKDYSGSGNDLTAQNGPSYVNGSDGATQGAYHFTAASSQGLEKVTPTGLPTGAVTRTMCAWVKYDSFSGIQAASNYGSSGTNNATIIGLGSSSQPGFDFYNSGIYSGIISAKDTWYHICGTYDPSGPTGQLFVNGNLEKSGTAPTLTTTNSLLRIGRSIASSFMDGAVDDVRIYNRVLFIAEIRELSGFAPGQVSGNTLWLDAGRAVFNNAGTTLATNTQLVQQWNDISFANGTANAVNVTQASASNKPTWQSGVLNGQPIVRFDGGDELDSASILGSNVFATNELNWFIVQNQDASKAKNGPLGWIQSTTNKALFNLSYNDTLILTYGNPATYQLSGAQPTGWDNAFHISEAYLNTANAAAILVDGTSISSGTMTTTLSTGSSSPLIIGNADGDHLTGDIAEIIVYKNALTQTERDKVTCYLSKKYNINVSTVCD